MQPCNSTCNTGPRLRSQSIEKKQPLIRSEICPLPEWANTLEGRYANYFEAGYTKFEFYIDFGQVDPQLREGILHSRIVMTPASAVVFREIFERVLARYEAEVGRIEA
jgi:hypothetical protein